MKLNFWSSSIDFPPSLSEKLARMVKVEKDGGVDLGMCEIATIRRKPEIAILGRPHPRSFQEDLWTKTYQVNLSSKPIKKSYQEAAFTNEDLKRYKATEDNNIYPTRTCFDDTCANLIILVEEDGLRLTNGTLLIVHGIIAPEGKNLCHAWIELDEKLVVDSGIFRGERIMFIADLKEFYAGANVKEVTKYTPVDAAGIETRTGQKGPWEEKYRALCGDVIRERAQAAGK